MILNDIIDQILSYLYSTDRFSHAQAHSFFFGGASRPDSQDTFEQFLNVQTLGFMKIGGLGPFGLFVIESHVLRFASLLMFFAF